MDSELQELHRGARDEQKRLIPDPGPCEPPEEQRDDDRDPPDMSMECTDCGWEGDDSMILYEGFQKGSRYTWREIEDKNINVEGFICPSCDLNTVQPAEDW